MYGHWSKFELADCVPFLEVLSESTSGVVEGTFQASSLVLSTSFAGDFYVKAIG